MDKREIRNKLKEYATEVGKHIPIKKLLVYGSYSSKKFNKDSDIDVAIVIKNNSIDIIKCESLLWRIASEVDSRIEPMIFEEGNDPSGFLEDILKHGEVIVNN
ncbi:MAG: nucleotidyltransferase domain-containing protein [Bacteroidota bacterium]|nr:nucleotidyltransferase domain-containing protein [Bacteroidota bacterium]